MEGTNETPPIEATPQEENPPAVDSPMEVFEDAEDGGPSAEPDVPAEPIQVEGNNPNENNASNVAAPEIDEAPEKEEVPESHENEEIDKNDEKEDEDVKESDQNKDERAVKDNEDDVKADEADVKEDVKEDEADVKEDEGDKNDDSVEVIQEKQEIIDVDETVGDLPDAPSHNESEFLQDVEMHDMDDKYKQEDEPMEMDAEEETNKSVDKTVSDDPFDQIKHAVNDNGHDEVDRPASRPSNEHHDEESNDQDDHNDTHDVQAMDEEDLHKDKEGEEEDEEPNASRAHDEDDHNATEANDDSAALDETDVHDDSAAHEESVAEEGVDEITEGEGVDEDVCLLPDDEREISEADKEAAILAREADTAADQEEGAEKEPSSEAAPSEPTIEVQNESTEQDTTVDLTEQDKETETHDEPDQDHDHEHEEPEAPEVESPPKANEIRELGDKTEGSCFKCNESKQCQYSLVDEVGSEPKHLCSFDCVQSLRNENAEKYTLIQKKASIFPIFDIEAICDKCQDKKACKFRYKTNAGYTYLCSAKCVEYYTSTNAEKYSLKKKRYIIDEILASEQKDASCVQCTETKTCGYHFKQDDDDELFVCNDDCLNLLMTEQPELFRLKRRSVRVRNLPKSFPDEVVEVTDNKVVARTEEEAENARLDRDASFIRRCTQCFSVISITDKTLQWETYDFCNEKCLGVYQNTIGAHCATCSCSVSVTSLGKYCVRFGFEVKQFCRSSCLDSYKKSLKVCSFCQRDIAHGKLGFLAPIGDKKVFKDFCTKECLKKYEEVLNPKKKQVLKTCAVCNNEKIAKIDIVLDGKDHHFCSTPCFSAFKFVNNVSPDQCAMCQTYFERKSSDPHTIYATDKTPDASCFCTKICMNLFIITNRKIVSCNWCKVKKYNFDMIQKVASNMSLCSLNCLTLCEVSVNALSQKQVCCDHCKLIKTPQYHLTMSDASVRNFCTYQCVMSFQSQFNKTPLTIDNEEVSNSPVPTGLPKRVKKALPPPIAPAPLHTAKNKRMVTRKQPPPPPVPVIASVQSLATRSSSRSKGTPQGKGKQMDLPDVRVTLEPLSMPSSGRVSLRERERESRELRETRESSRLHHRDRGEPRDYREREMPPAPPPPPKVEVRTQVVSVPEMPKPVSNASTMCKPITQSKGVSCKPLQMDAECQTDAYLQRKIVIPIPIPIYLPTPMHMYSLPTPIPVPIPLPIPVPVFIPTTRNSANGIMKEIKKIQDKMPTDPYEAELLMMAEMVAGEKKKDDTDSDSGDDQEDNYIENNVPFNEDLVQMALKMASNDFDEPAVDLESAMTANTIHPQQQPHHHMIGDDQAMHHHQLLLLEQQRQAQMSNRGRKRGSTNRPNNNNRAIQSPNKRIKREQIPEPSPEPPREPAEKPDANMCLKYTFGVNAWKQWVLTKNADLEKSTMRRKPFKSEILQMTADELNYSLCLFVKEVRKPNGTEYAPDTIYYLVLGIQQYLFENGRIDNIFTDPYYERFTDCLDEVAKKFSVLYNDSQYIVTRVEEEHLWECKQLGAHSPHVLLSTLMFFNTKHFNLTTVEEHMELSFSHIMKHWKRNPGNQAGAAKTPGSRNVLLRFYPPQSSLAANSRKKKVYEQQENEENPLRCPVKLYEFYLSKCPESVKTRNDVFYLQPERSCVPDSPVWYSTQPLSQQALSKMLHRVKMVKEINIALLTS